MQIQNDRSSLSVGEPFTFTGRTNARRRIKVPTARPLRRTSRLLQYVATLTGLICSMGVAWAQYAGTYAGTFSGGESGTWEATVDASSQITAFITDRFGDTYFGTGDVDPTGGTIIGFVDVGATFGGQIDAAGRMSGTWSNPFFGISGSFTGRRLNPTITTVSPLPSGTVGSAYSRAITASGGTTPYFWSIVSGDLPSGLSLSGSGLISGLPNTVTTTDFTVQVISFSGYASTKGFSLTILQETNKPVVTITAPTANQRWSNAVFTARGTARDNLRVTNLWYQLNSGDWIPADTTNNWTNWTATLTGLIPGTNVLRAYATDPAGNLSPTNSVNLVYVLSDRLTVAMMGRGTLTPNYSNAVLEINRAYAMTANFVSGAGYAFANWTDGAGGVLTNGRTLQFIMASNLTLIANFVDTNRPAVTITAPTANQRWSNAVFTARGTARDNLRVTNLWYQLNSGDWIPADTTNNWTNWTATLTGLIPGTNVLRAYATDPAGNLSPTNSVNLVYVLSDRLTVAMMGRGTLTPNYSNAVLEINRAYAMTANFVSGAGYAFANWTDGAGGVLTNGRTLQFIMASNLTLIANFVDTNRPTVTLTAPTANQRLSNAVITVKGTASDNARIAGVWYQLNGPPWLNAASTNGWTNWTAVVALPQGTNTVRAFAMDLAANVSLTNSVTFVASNAFRMSLAFDLSQSPSVGGLDLSLDVSRWITGRIQVSTDLVNWTTLTNFVSANSPLRFRDPAATTQPLRFYRAVTP